MSKLTYILRSLWFYKKQHLAIFLATVVSTAVLTGALIIGDSVEYSLKSLVDKRLGKTEYALQTGDRFVRAQLAKNIADEQNVSTSAVLMMKGIASNSETQNRLNNIQVLGIDKSFWNLADENISELNADEAILSHRVATILALKVGDEFLLRVENADVIPLNAPFASEEVPSVSFRLKVKSIAHNDKLGRFSLRSNQATPANVFVSRKFLSEKVELKALANLILVAPNSEKQIETKELESTLAKVWQLEDASLKIKKLEQTNQYEIGSSRIFIDSVLSEAVLSLPYKSEKILTYLVNSITYKQNTTPYSFVAATSNPEIAKNLQHNEIVVNQWLADDLNIKIGDSISLDYFIIGPLRTLEEKTSFFEVKKIIPTEHQQFNSSYMPDFPGLADAGSCSDWETGIPIDLKRIRDKDEDYWDNHQGTPKAYISIETGHKLWSNKFGNYSGFRFNTKDFKPTVVEKTILEKIKPQDLNFIFLPVKEQGFNAVTNAVDFGELFLSLSFFVIAAAVLLIILIFSLNTESRNAETGILSGLGFTKKTIINLRISESVFIALLGSIAGAFVGIVYNNALMLGLNSVWQDAVRTKMIDVYILPQTLIIGALSGFIIALLVIFFTTRKKLKSTVISMVQNTESTEPNKAKTNNLSLKLTAILSFLLTISLIIYSIITSIDKNSTLFLSAGALYLIAMVASMSLYFQHLKNKTHNNAPSIYRLALKNAFVNKGRSIAAIVLLALGTFSVIITGANRKTFYGVENHAQSGTGGFQYWAETSMPLLYDLNTKSGKENYGLADETLLDSVSFLQFHSLEGDDASCLNLNQVEQPKILGVNPKEFSDRKAFSFAKLHQQINNDNAWLELKKDYGNNVIPAIADQTVIVWGLKKSVGDTLIYLNEFGKEIKLVLIAGLNASVFQGSILIDDQQFMKHFPSVSGSRTMLIETKNEDKKAISDLLSAQLIDYGIEISRGKDRLAEFYSVSNTYLSVFMALGGLGIIIGTLGLGIVLLRNMIQRRHEFALLAAIGFKKNEILKVVLIENIFLLVTGLMLGITAAFIGILPAVVSPSFSVPYSFVFMLIAAILFSGLLWIYIPAKLALKNKLIDGLKNND